MTLPKVLVATFDPIPSPDGKAVRVESILRALQGRYDVDLLAPRLGDVPHIEIRWSARVLRVPLGRGSLHAQVEAFARAVRRQLHSEDYRVVHLCDPRIAGPVCELAPERGFRFVFEPLGVPLLDLERLFPRVGRNATFVERLRAAEAMCVNAAHGIIVATEIARAHVSALGPCADRVHRVPGCVDLCAAEPARGVVSSTVQAAPGAPKATVAPSPKRERTEIVYAGELAPWQGVGTLLRAMKLLLRARPGTKLRLVGYAAPEHEAALRALVARLEIGDAVSFSAPVPHTAIGERLRAADLIVVPGELDERARRFGPFPQKIAEAFAAGVPCVAAELPAHRELAPPEDDLVRYFPSGDAGALAEQARALLASPGQSTVLAGRGLAVARDALSSQKFRERLLAVYQAL